MKIDGWTVLDEKALILYQEYTFTKGAYATTLVFRGRDGLVVVSPGPRTTDREYDALREHGEVTALVANNAYHHLGQAPWRARFPNAVSYAPSGALASLEKKNPTIQFKALQDLPLPEHITSAELPGFKSGETFFSIRSERGTVWYTGDLLTNIHALPNPPIKWLFTWTDSAPGFRLFKPAVWGFVRDKKTLRAFMLDRVEKDPPAAVVSAHGPAVEGNDVSTMARLQIERL